MYFMGLIAISLSSILISIQPFPFIHDANQVKHSTQAATCERITKNKDAARLHPFIQMCVPIYNGVSPCSTSAHQKLTTMTTNISHTPEKSSPASAHLCINTIRHQTEACCGLGVWYGALGHVAQDVCMRPLPAPGAWQGWAMTAMAQ